MSPTRRGGGRETAGPGARHREKNPPLHRARWRPRTLSDRQIRSEALGWLLPLLKSAVARTFRPTAVRDTADLLLRAAVLRASVHRARALCRRGYSDRTARWLFGHLVLRKTQRALTLTIRRQIRPFVPSDPVDVAIDFHDRPYYGQPADPHRRQVVKTKEERGTHRAHRFASLSILLPRYRLIASLRFHPHNGGTLAAVQKALHDFRQAGGQLRAVFLDRGFYNYAVLSWLRAHGIPAVVPLRLGSRQRKRWERGKRSYTTTHVLKDSKGRSPPLELTIHVVVRYQAGKKWGKHGCQYPDLCRARRILAEGDRGPVPRAVRHRVELPDPRPGVGPDVEPIPGAAPPTCRGGDAPAERMGSPQAPLRERGPPRTDRVPHPRRVASLRRSSPDAAEGGGLSPRPSIPPRESTAATATLTTSGTHDCMNCKRCQVLESRRGLQFGIQGVASPRSHTTVVGGHCVWNTLRRTTHDNLGSGQGSMGRSPQIQTDQGTPCGPQRVVLKFSEVGCDLIAKDPDMQPLRRPPQPRGDSLKPSPGITRPIYGGILWCIMRAVRLSGMVAGASIAMVCLIAATAAASTVVAPYTSGTGYVARNIGTGVYTNTKLTVWPSAATGNWTTWLYSDANAGLGTGGTASIVMIGTLNVDYTPTTWGGWSLMVPDVVTYGWWALQNGCVQGTPNVPTASEYVNTSYNVYENPGGWLGTPIWHMVNQQSISGCSGFFSQALWANVTSPSFGIPLNTCGSTATNCTLVVTFEVTTTTTAPNDTSAAACLDFIRAGGSCSGMGYMAGNTGISLHQLTLT